MNSKRQIVLELNELCPHLLQEFMNQGALPNLSQIYSHADCYETHVDCDLGQLEPWTQWVTVHTGVSSEKHKIHRLGQAQNLEYDSIWDILSRRGFSSWLCGSMNTKWDQNDQHIMAIPDPWSINAESSPKSLDTFYEFVRANVQEHTNARFKQSLQKNLEFLIFMLGHGLSVRTVSMLIQQMLRQIRNAPDQWKKPFLLDCLQFDVFSHVYRKNKPDFATFFSNSTAHFQHKFWRYMEPEAFTLKPSDDEIKQYQNAILSAYQNHDALVGKALDLADSQTSIVISTAISQRPFSELDEVGGKRFYRPYSLKEIPSIFELEHVVDVCPVMSHQFYVVFESEQQAIFAAQQLKEYTVEGEALFSVRHQAKRVFLGCRIIRVLKGQPKINAINRELSFFDVFYLADNLKSGAHSSKGVLWIYNQNRQQTIFKEPLPLESVMTRLLDEYDMAS
ncbi:hypothetical protein DBZ36_17135 [Alginatibacterium sediminis]|uniref:Uncharacterized protein n=1 Tax=Alginatibacterium sediminis TaxID=2164068 RepID=A0A420E7G8_9ALTE|nr:alkaline phosphatase family protein [Alginatibacterium sediminis]RKF14378.1 hypothetical protein DBZ36_17135 [Alginatibacterium sediminis]